MNEEDILVVIDELMYQYRAFKDNPSNFDKLTKLALSEFELQVIEGREHALVNHEKITRFRYNVSSISILIKLIRHIQYELL